MQTVLDEARWTARRAEHERRVDALTGDHVQRRRDGESHPVLDFLFTYYNLRPAHLRRWSPGHGVTITGSAASTYDGRTGWAVDADTDSAMCVADEYVEKKSGTLEFIVALLASTASKAPRTSCFGMHEWAMVYRADERRHSAPLRLGSAGTDSVVESMPLRCTHFDAFRFFTPDATGLNETPLTRLEQVRTEQPGCLHANMDLYKWCAKLGPLIASETTADCFELALTAREIDMRASPYDLQDYGYPPIEIETPAGRAEYVRAQAAVAAEASVLREGLLTRCRELLAHRAGPRGSTSG